MSIPLPKNPTKIEAIAKFNNITVQDLNLICIASRNYILWSRVWVIQELLLSHGNFILCGTELFSFDYLHYFLGPIAAHLAITETNNIYLSKCFLYLRHYVNVISVEGLERC